MAPGPTYSNILFRSSQRESVAAAAHYVTGLDVYCRTPRRLVETTPAAQDRAHRVELEQCKQRVLHRTRFVLEGIEILHGQSWVLEEGLRDILALLALRI